MKNRKYIKLVTFVLIFTLITIVTILCQKMKKNKKSIPTHQNLEIETSDTVNPYSYYRIHLYLDKNDNWDIDTFYYKFLEKPDDDFFSKTIYVEDRTLDTSIFEEYTVLAFAKKSNYSFSIESYYLSDSSELELTLNEYAIYEDLSASSDYAFGGIIMIPKEKNIENIKIFLNEIL